MAKGKDTPAEATRLYSEVIKAKDVMSDKGYEVQRMAKDEYNQMKLSFGDEGYIKYLKTSTIR